MMGLVTRCCGWCDTKGCLSTALLVGCIVVSPIEAKWLIPTLEDYVLEKAVKSSLIILFCLGILGMLYLYNLARDPTDSFSEDENNEDEEINVHFLHRLQLCLLGIFAMGSVGHDLLKIVDIGRCIDKINKDLDSKRTSLAYECIKLVFELGQIYFISHFWRYRCRSKITRFILGLILGANLCIWIYVLVSESLVTRNHKSKNTDHNYTNSSNSASCENGNNETSEMLESWEPYLYPLTIEFCLMASVLLGSMWGWNLKRNTVVNDQSASQSTPSADSPSVEAQQSRREDRSQAAINIMSESNEEEDVPKSKDSEKKHLLPSNDNGDHNHDNIGCFCKLTSCNEDKSRTCPEVFYLATLLSTTSFFLAVANQGNPWLGYCSTYQVLHLGLLVSSGFVLYKMRKEVIQLQQFGPNQILLLVSTSALFVLTSLELIPPLYNYSELKKWEKLLIATDFFLLISLFFQTWILLKSCKMPHSENRCLQRCFSIIAVFNLYMWFEDSIFVQKLDSKLDSKHHKFYYPLDWTICKLILRPLCMFYRIFVAEMFGERFFKL